MEIRTPLPRVTPRDLLALNAPCTLYKVLPAPNYHLTMLAAEPKWGIPPQSHVSLRRAVQT